MSTYTIEDGIPLPPSAYSHNQRKPKSEMRQALDSMKPGQSLLVGTVEEWQRLSSMVSSVSNAGVRKFASRKIAGQGWRVWRLE